MREHGIAGMAVAVFADGEAHYFSYGVASMATAVPISADTLFEIGSLSKTYTATLAALASAEGKLDLQAPARRYQPAMAGYFQVGAMTPMKRACVPPTGSCPALASERPSTSGLSDKM